MRTASKWKIGCTTAFGIFLAILVPWPHPGRDTGDPCDSPAWDLPHGMVAYIYAGILESRWYAARPKTRSELERLLSLHSTREIVPAQSCWGRRRVLAPGEQMIQYQILWHAPLDVVYDASGAIEAIFTSYE